ncbi:MAG: cupin domain-containing protein, partial [Acidobacteriota bacterium]
AAAPGASPAAGAGAAPAAAPPRPAAAPVPPGTLISRLSSTISYAERPVTHRLENIGEGLFRAMVVVNETAGDDATTQEAAGFSGKPELTNRWFRAYRFALAPGESTPPHRHTTPVAVFQASSGRGGVATGAMKFEFNDPGQWAFFDAGDAHAIKNAGEAPMEFVEVEVRRTK